MDEKVIYRKAQLADAPIIQSFQMAMALETEKIKLDEKILAEGVRAVFARPELGQYHVCTQGDEVIGALMVTQEWSDWRNGSVWWIQSVYFKPEFRGQSLFTGMYSYIQNLAQAEKNVRGIRLYVDQSNKPAQAIYSKLGMNGDHYRVYEWMKS